MLFRQPGGSRRGPCASVRMRACDRPCRHRNPDSKAGCAAAPAHHTMWRIRLDPSASDCLFCFAPRPVVADQSGAARTDASGAPFHASLICSRARCRFSGRLSQAWTITSLHRRSAEFCKTSNRQRRRNNSRFPTIRIRYGHRIEGGRHDGVRFFQGRVIAAVLRSAPRCRAPYMRMYRTKAFRRRPAERGVCSPSSCAAEACPFLSILT